MTGKAKTDWEAIERHYRAGVVSLREIGREHGLSDTAIRKHAGANGWERDLSQKVRDRARAKLVRTGSQSGSREPCAQTDAEIVEEASETQVTVVRSHRKDIAQGRSIAKTLFDELIESTSRRDEIEEAIEEDTADDKKADRRNAMLRAVALPGRAATLKDLAASTRIFMLLERQAFNLDGPSEGDNGEFGEGMVRAMSRAANR